VIVEKEKDINDKCKEKQKRQPQFFEKSAVRRQLLPVAL
jgi:hypothetical protein